MATRVASEVARVSQPAPPDLPDGYPHYVPAGTGAMIRADRFVETPSILYFKRPNFAARKKGVKRTFWKKLP